MSKDILYHNKLCHQKNLENRAIRAFWIKNLLVFPPYGPNADFRAKNAVFWPEIHFVWKSSKFVVTIMTGHQKDNIFVLTPLHGGPRGGRRGPFLAKKDRNSARKPKNGPPSDQTATYQKTEIIWSYLRTWGTYDPIESGPSDPKKWGLYRHSVKKCRFSVLSLSLCIFEGVIVDKVWKICNWLNSGN